MRLNYSKLETRPIVILTENGFLAGSVTNAPIKTGSVTVQDYGDGFAESTSSEDWTLTF